MTERRMTHLGQFIKFKLAREGLTCQDLAYALGIGRGTLARYMYGDSEPPGWVILYLSRLWHIQVPAIMGQPDRQELRRTEARYAERKAAADERRRRYLEEKRWK